MKSYSCVFNDGKGWCLHYQLWFRAFPNCKGYSAEEKHQLDTAQTTLPVHLPILREGAPLGEPGTSRRGYTRDSGERVAGVDTRCSAVAEPGGAVAPPTWQL